MPDPFHPDLRRMQRLPRVALSERHLRRVRLIVRLMPGGRPRPRVLPVDGQVTVRWFEPAQGRTQGRTQARDHGGALLWLHGGGMVLGAAKQDDWLCRRISERLGIAVASVDYRLAPEHPFPAPLEDCYTALRWLAARRGIRRVVVGGASAGGGLAAGVALAARDRGDVALAGQLLVYPMIDDRTVARTDLDETNFRLWNNASNRFGWSSYLGGTVEVSPLAAPARCADLSGLPPTWIGVGTNDLFHDEDLAYAERLRAAGVPVDLEVVRGAYHGFDGVEPQAPVARAFHASALDFLARVLG